jgi:hypothetical protein
MGEKKKALALAFIGLFGACAAYGDVAYEVSSGIGNSDNITRVDENEIDETLASAGLLLDWEADSRRLSGAAQVDLSYVEYLDDTYDGEILGTASGNVDFGILPERLHWKVDDNFGQARSDPFQPVTPDNRENVNYFSTGPELILRFGQAMSATLYGTYSLTDYEDSPLDAERVSFGVALGRDISERSNWALNYTTDESTFDAATMPGYERRAAFASYELGTGGRTAVSTRLGYNWVELDGADEEGGLLADLSLTRELSASSALVVSAAKNFSDAGESLGGPGGGVTSITASADPFESTQASLEWRFSRRRTTLGLSTNYNERKYQTQSQFDSKSIAYRADVGRHLRSTLRFALRLTHSTEEFQAGVESNDWSADALLDWQFGRRAGLELRVERNARSSSIGTGEYRENRAYLGFTFHGDRAPELR